MATRSKGAKDKPSNRDHQISDHDSSEDDTKGANALEFSEKQMETVSLLVKSAVSAAVAQVLPLARTQNLAPPSSSQNAAGFASPPSSSAETERNQNNSDREPPEDGEVKDEELDDYERALSALLGDNRTTGPEISEKVGRLLERCLGTPLDEKVVKQKRDEFPRPENIKNLKVPRTNSLIFNKATTNHQNLDRNLQLTQSYLIGGIVAVGRQAEKLLGLRNWAANLEEADREQLPDEISKLTGMYVELMDGLILFTRVMSDLTNVRKRMFKGDMPEPYKSLLEDDKNPTTPDWLAGEDVHAAIRKAKANAFAAEDLSRKNKWPKKSFNRNSTGYRPYDQGKRRQNNENAGGYKQNQANRRSHEGFKQGENRKNQDFRRRDSR